MKVVLSFLLFLFSFMSFAQNIKEYQWKNRLLVLVSKEPNSWESKQQRKIFEQNQLQLEERNMLLLNRQANSQDLARFSLDKNFEGVVLIGKDGGVKLKKPFLIKPQVIFDLVDTMPMRRLEMQNTNKY
ncbi:MAG: DUF4174 domain-containing protein [Bacteroidota bacterium]